MNNKNLKLVIAGAALLVVGGLICLVAAFLPGFEHSELNLGTVHYEQRSRSIDMAFDSIFVEEPMDDIYIVPSPDAECHIEYFDSSDYYYRISVEKSCLSITLDSKNDGIKWFGNINFSTDFSDHPIRIYLPEDSYRELELNIVSANAYIEDIDFGSIDISGVSGNINLSELSAAQGIDIELVSGQTELMNCTASEIEIESVSGGINLQNCDAENLRLESVSGNISGVLLSEKDFEVDTVSGTVDVPDGWGGKCRVSTTSGSIRFSIA